MGSQDYFKFYFIKYDYNPKDSHQDDVDPEEEELALVRVGPKQTVFNPFPRRHLEPSPSECGR